MARPRGGEAEGDHVRRAAQLAAGDLLGHLRSARRRPRGLGRGGCPKTGLLLN